MISFVLKWHLCCLDLFKGSCSVGSVGRKYGRVLPSFAELRRRKGCRLLRWTWGRIRMLGGGILMRCLAD